MQLSLASNSTTSYEHYQVKVVHLPPSLALSSSEGRELVVLDDVREGQALHLERAPT